MLVVYQPRFSRLTDNAAQHSDAAKVAEQVTPGDAPIDDELERKNSQSVVSNLGSEDAKQRISNATNVSSVNSYDSHNSHCPICLDEFETGEQVCRIACSHQFHEGCLSAWFEKSHTCPLCMQHYRTGRNLMDEDEVVEPISPQGSNVVGIEGDQKVDAHVIDIINDAIDTHASAFLQGEHDVKSSQMAPTTYALNDESNTGRFEQTQESEAARLARYNNALEIVRDGERIQHGQQHMHASEHVRLSRVRTVLDNERGQEFPEPQRAHSMPSIEIKKESDMFDTMIFQQPHTSDHVRASRLKNLQIDADKDSKGLAKSNEHDNPQSLSDSAASSVTLPGSTSAISTGDITYADQEQDLGVIHSESERSRSYHKYVRIVSESEHSKSKKSRHSLPSSSEYSVTTAHTFPEQNEKSENGKAIVNEKNSNS